LQIGASASVISIKDKIGGINMSILIAVDHGNYACKTPNFSFTSGLMELSGKATIIRHIFVFPQEFAAVASRAQDMLDMPRAFIVDIGGYTTDVLLIREGVPDLQYCRSLEDGVITMYNPIIGQVNAKHDMLIVLFFIVSGLQAQQRNWQYQVGT